MSMEDGRQWVMEEEGAFGEGQWVVGVVVVIGICST